MSKILKRDVPTSIITSKNVTGVVLLIDEEMYRELNEFSSISGLIREIADAIDKNGKLGKGE